MQRRGKAEELSSASFTWSKNQIKRSQWSENLLPERVGLKMQEIRWPNLAESLHYKPSKKRKTDYREHFKYGVTSAKRQKLQKQGRRGITVGNTEAEPEKQGKE